MNFLRSHWFDVGGILAILTLIFLLTFHASLTKYSCLMWLSLISLFLHQMEEYRIAGTFPGLINQIMFPSDIPDRYPLNSNTSLLLNVGIGWTLYFLAAVIGEHLLWLGMAAIIVSAGNILAHTFLFNLKGKTYYNAGLVTCWIFFAPCTIYFFLIIHREHLAASLDYYIGIPLGIIINIFGILKPIQWLADRNSPYLFETWHLLPPEKLISKN